MNLLFFTDTHIRGTNPKSRIDNFYETLKEKFEEIIELCNIHNIDFVLHGGDWFDRPDISPSIVREFAMLIKKIDRPIYTIAGNHDIYGYNPKTLSRTMLGILEGTQIINILEENQPIMLQKDNINLLLHGSSYTVDIDEAYEKYYIVKNDTNAPYCINMIHGMLLPKPCIEGLKHTLIKNILKTEANITLCGHYHSGFGVISHGDKYFVNPGSLVRISAVKSELIRIPEVILIKLSDKIKITPIPLKSAKPSDIVLDRTHIENKILKNDNISNFLSSFDFNTEMLENKTDINKIIEDIANTEGLDHAIKIEAIKRIDLARNSLDKEEVEF